MPVIENDMFSNLANKTKEYTFCDRPENRKASQDLRYLASQLNLTASESLGKIKFIAVGQDVGLFLPVPAQMSDDMVTFPMSELDINNPLHNVAVVLYSGENVADVLIFNSSNWLTKKGLFSPFKVLTKTGEYGVKIAKKEKLTEYKFGNVLKDYIK